MKIVLCGNHNPYFFNSVQCREKALRELGHEVIFFDKRKFLIPGKIRKIFPALHAWDLRRMEKELALLVRVAWPDLFLVIGGGISPDVVKEISARDVPTLLWTTDAPFDVPGLQKEAAAYDHVICSGSEAVPIVAEVKGSSRVDWIPFAADPKIHCPAMLSSEDKAKYGREVAFVGSYYPNRQKTLESISDFRLGIWGPSWDRAEKTPLASLAEARRVNVAEWTKIYTAANIVVVVHYRDGETPCDQASPKLFEALSCGAFVLCDDQKDARTLFQDKKHLVFFKDNDDLRAKVEYYLPRFEERRRIAAAGREIVLARHTYHNRMEEMLKIVVKG
ncbi:MAG: glycosyltransferase [Candidatus Omnitrophica bacterium]|nr:glycosyltransferase [Candidatus Omnitrophota bacterium]